MSQIYPFPISDHDRVSGALASGEPPLAIIARMEQMRAVQAEVECISLADLAGRFACVVSWMLENQGQPLPPAVEAAARLAINDMLAKMKRGEPT